MRAPLVPLPQSASCPEPQSPLELIIFGSTGSIGCSALEIVRRHPQRFKVFALVAATSEEKLLEQALEFKPRYALLTKSESAKRNFPCEVLYGEKAACDLAQHPQVDLVLAAVVGIAGLSQVISALQAGKRVALANKESLVCAGELISKLIGSGTGGILMPVDSEHSAIWQALQADRLQDVERLILTASGGPFLNMDKTNFAGVTPQQAIAHPRWNMGAKISVDSATLMNKALELIEAHYLFGLEQEKIEVLIHPQSIVHSLVAYKDGSQLAQLSQPDMKGPLSYALNYPYGRLENVVEALDLAKLKELQFLSLDQDKFPAVLMARQALKSGGAMPAVLNIANELAVSDFLKGKLAFDRLLPVVEQICSRYVGRKYNTLQDLLSLQAEIKNTF